MTAPHIRRILVPVDFSFSSREAIQHGLWLAERAGASVTLLHVWQPPLQLTADAVAMMAGSVNSTLEQGDLKRAEGDLEAWRRSYGGRGVSVDTRFEQGPIAGTILRVVGDQGYDLVVMGTHGRTGLARLVMGSVAQHVVARAPCPVLTVHGHEEDSPQPSAS